MKHQSYLACVLLLVAGIACCACEKEEDNDGIRKGDYLFGTLMSNPDKAAGQAAVGIGCASLTLRWEEFEPSEGVINTAYVEQIRAQIEQFQSAGMRIVLDFGIHYPPRWATELAYCRHVNQYGDAYVVTQSSGLNTLNGVFNRNVREKMAAYVGRVFQAFDPSTFFAIRIGWSYYAELHYPERSYNGRNNCYWGYDPIALGQVPELLPEGIEPNPVPEWMPGQPSENNEKARRFIEWYLESLRNFQDFQIAALRRHYDGYINALYADWGVRPGQIDEAVAGDLDGLSFAEKYGQLQKGYDHARFIAAIRDPKVVVYNTCLNSNYPYPMTASIVDDNGSDPRYWSPVHFEAWCAEQNPVRPRVWAENDGNDNYYMMQICFKRMQRYNLMGIMWAFEYNLYSNDPNLAQLYEYARFIEQYSL